MAKSDRLADAVQAYFHEIVMAAGHSHRRADQIRDEMFAALVELRPDAADGPEKPLPAPVAPSIPAEDVSDSE